jgi:hypothetical protein
LVAGVHVDVQLLLVPLPLDNVHVVGIPDGRVPLKVTVPVALVL